VKPATEAPVNGGRNYDAVAAVTSAAPCLADSMGSGRGVVELLNKLGVVRPEMVTLQIGSGLGRVEFYLSSQVRECWGADVSPSMVRRARRLVPFPNVHFQVTDGVTLSPWQDGAFDLVYSFFVFQHLPREQFERYLGQARAKLAPGGHLVFHLLVDERGIFPDPPSSHPYGLRYYRRQEVEERLSRAGFTALRRCDLDGQPDDGATGDVVFCAATPTAARTPRTSR
jgi:SAM-dependent methyltransferase